MSVSNTVKLLLKQIQKQFHGVSILNQYVFLISVHVELSKKKFDFVIWSKLPVVMILTYLHPSGLSI